MFKFKSLTRRAPSFMGDDEIIDFEESNIRGTSSGRRSKRSGTRSKKGSTRDSLKAKLTVLSIGISNLKSKGCAFCTSDISKHSDCRDELIDDSPRTLHKKNKNKSDDKNTKQKKRLTIHTKKEEPTVGSKYTEKLQDEIHNFSQWLDQNICKSKDDFCEDSFTTEIAREDLSNNLNKLDSADEQDSRKKKYMSPQKEGRTLSSSISEDDCVNLNELFKKSGYCLHKKIISLDRRCSASETSTSDKVFSDTRFNLSKTMPSISKSYNKNNDSFVKKIDEKPFEENESHNNYVSDSISSMSKSSRFDKIDSDISLSYCDIVKRSTNTPEPSSSPLVLSHSLYTTSPS